jgi:hypothetical protein
MKQVKSIKDLIGDKWRITYDEAWKHESNEEKLPNKIDYEQVKIRGGGFMRLHDLKTKTFVIWTQRYKLANELAEEFPEIRMDKMDKEADLYVPLHLVDTILERMHGNRKKVFSEEWKQQARERMTRLHAEGKVTGRKKKEAA